MGRARRTDVRRGPLSDVRRVVDGGRAVSLYSFEAGPASVPMAETFEVRGDRIARIDLTFDPARLLPGGG